ncbi:MAG: FAD-dependent oxidoreductase [Simkaniaceae bacterium]|nr:FAD-dependent oxidoreductase [Simkaniaceae bacterium]
MFDVIVIGAGAGGLVIAIGAAKAGKKTLLIETGPYGGDCTNFGCIPSKSLIASSKEAYMLKHADRLGIDVRFRTFDTVNAFKRVRDIVTEVRSREDPSALKHSGVETLTGTASFHDSRTLLVNGRKVRGKEIVIATGSEPTVPDVEGLAGTPYLTNETVFELERVPPDMIFIGAGPIGCELAQAFAGLGSEVTVIAGTHMLAREDPRAREVIAKQFVTEGMTLQIGERPKRVTYDPEKGFTVLVGNKELKARSLFVATGRRPRLEGLHLARAGIATTDKGITVDPYGRTSQKHIWAVGDVVGAPFFTHLAENRARTVLKNILLPFKSKISTQPVPRVTYTDPEIASLGLLTEEAVNRYGKGRIAVYTVPFTEVDRSITNGRTEGFVTIVTKKWSSKILGATIVGARAGEMLMEISMAMYTKTPLRKLSGLIHPYPIESAAIRKAADMWLTQTVLGAIRRNKL